MKKLIVILVTLVVIFLSAFTGTVNANPVSSGTVSICSPIDHVEFTFVNGIWLKVTYYLDGKIDVTPVAKPPLF